MKNRDIDLFWRERDLAERLAINAWYSHDRGDISQEQRDYIIHQQGLTVSDIEVELDAQWYSDAHKELYGNRPSGEAMQRFRASSPSERREVAGRISASIEEDVMGDFDENGDAKYWN